jgi:hypothetical protein
MESLSDRTFLARSFPECPALTIIVLAQPEIGVPNYRVSFNLIRERIPTEELTSLFQIGRRRRARGRDGAA